MIFGEFIGMELFEYEGGMLYFDDEVLLLWRIIYVNGIFVV